MDTAPTRLHPRRRLAPALAALTICGALAGSAAATTPSPWRGPDSLSPQGSTIAFPPQLSAADTGTALAVWAQGTGAGATVRVAQRDLGGPWRTAINLSAPGIALEPVADVNDQDDAVVAWIGGTGRTARAVVRPGNTGDWLPAVELDVSEPATDVDVVVAPSGDMTALWRTASGAVRASARPAAAGAWTPAQTLGATAGGGAVSLAVAGDGTVLAQWGSGSGPKQTAVRTPAGAWGAPETLPDGGLLASVHIAVDADGDAVAVELGGGPGDPVVQAAARPAGGAWGPFERISARSAAGVSSGDVALDADGNAVAVWQQRDGARGAVVAAVRPAGGPWRPPVEVTPEDVNASSPALALGADGVATVTWLEDTAGEDLVRASRWSGFGGPSLREPWGEPETVGRGDDISPTLTAEPTGPGRALALWELSGVVRTADRQAGEPGDVQLSAAQLLINQRVSQAAVRRTNAVRAAIAGGIPAERVRDGGLPRVAFGTSVTVAGTETGAIAPPGASTPVNVPEPRGSGGDRVTLTTGQLLINQRVSQAAVRRANTLLRALDGGLSGGDVRDSSLTAAEIAAGLAAAPSGVPATPPEPADLTPPTRRPGGGQVRLSAAQLLINQRISQAAVIRANAALQRLERGLPGASFRDGSISSLDLR